MVKDFALWGIALNLIGVLGLFAFGAPFRIPLGGADMIVVGSTPHGRTLDRLFAALAWASLAFVVAGSACQACAVWLTP